MAYENAHQPEQVPPNQREEPARALSETERAAIGELAVEGKEYKTSAASAVQPSVAPEEAVDSKVPFYDQPEPRRQFLRQAGNFLVNSAIIVTGAGVSVKTGLPIIKKLTQGQQLVTLKGQFDELMQSLSSNETLVANSYNRGAVINLTQIMRQRGIQGKAHKRIGAVGMSTEYQYGTMDDHTGPTDQDHAVWQIIREQFGKDLLEQMGLEGVEVWIVAVPGAPPTEGYTNDSRPPYGINSERQLWSPGLWKFMTSDDPNAINILSYEGGGLNIFRELASTAAKLDHILSNIGQAMAESDHAASDAQGFFEYMYSEVMRLSTEYRDALVKSGDRVAEMNAASLENGSGGVLWLVMLMWMLDKERFIPYAPYQEGGRLGRWIVRDTTDPQFMNRTSLDTNAIKGGHDFARIASVRMAEAQTEGQKRVHANHPDLQIFTPSMIGVNELPHFYAAIDENGQIDPKRTGGGHAGWYGARYSGARRLQVFVAEIDGQLVVLDTITDLHHPNPNVG